MQAKGHPGAGIPSGAEAACKLGGGDGPQCAGSLRGVASVSGGGPAWLHLLPAAAHGFPGEPAGAGFIFVRAPIVLSLSSQARLGSLLAPFWVEGESATPVVKAEAELPSWGLDDATYSSVLYGPR